MVICPPGVLIVGEALVWAQVLHRDRPHGKVLRSSTEAVVFFTIDDFSPRSHTGSYRDDTHTKLILVG